MIQVPHLLKRRGWRIQMWHTLTLVGYLLYKRGDEKLSVTNQLYRDYYKPIWGSPWTNHSKIECHKSCLPCPIYFGMFTPIHFMIETISALMIETQRWFQIFPPKLAGTRKKGFIGKRKKDYTNGPIVATQICWKCSSLFSGGEGFQLDKNMFRMGGKKPPTIRSCDVWFLFGPFSETDDEFCHGGNADFKRPKNSQVDVRHLRVQIPPFIPLVHRTRPFCWHVWFRRLSSPQGWQLETKGAMRHRGPNMMAITPIVRVDLWVGPIVAISVVNCSNFGEFHVGNSFELLATTCHVSDGAKRRLYRLVGFDCSVFFRRLYRSCAKFNVWKSRWFQKFLEISPDCNWVICKVYRGFIFRGTKNSRMNYWQLLGGWVFRSSRCVEYTNYIFWVYPEKEKRILVNFFMVSNPKRRWFQRFFEFSNPKLGERYN